MIIGSGITIGSNITIGDLPTSPYLPPYLYEFSTFTFTTGNITGPTGPSASQLFANSYSNVGNTWLQSTAYFNTTGNGYQYWTVPQTGNYQIKVAGARSGYPALTANAGAIAWSANAAGRGVTIQGTVPLTQGQVITIAVGQPSANALPFSTFSVPGGGGGTFVVFTNNNAPIIVAGGGGGPGNWSSNTFLNNGGNAVTTTWGGNSWAGAPGGFNGQGGNAHVNVLGTTSTNGYDGGAGGGFYSNGAGGLGGNIRTNTQQTQAGAGGQSFLANLIGGLRTGTYAGQTSAGGFGGGGGAGALSGGGGGGYSGGGGGFGLAGTVVDSGGGGGSYIIDSATNVATSDGNYNGSNSFSGGAITNLGTGSYNTGHGYVTITKV